MVSELCRHIQRQWRGNSGMRSAPYFITSDHCNERIFHFLTLKQNATEGPAGHHGYKLEHRKLPVLFCCEMYGFFKSAMSQSKVPVRDNRRKRKSVQHHDGSRSGCKIYAPALCRTSQLFFSFLRSVRRNPVQVSSNFCFMAVNFTHLFQKIRGEEVYMY